MFEERQPHGLQANVITHNATISACEKGRQWERAVGLSEEMQSHGLQANVITYNATISACEKGRQWWRALGWCPVVVPEVRRGHVPEVRRGHGYTGAP